MDEEVKKVIKNKRKAWNRYFYCKSTTNHENNKEIWIRATEIIRKEETDFERKLAQP